MWCFARDYGLGGEAKASLEVLPRCPEGRITPSGWQGVTFRKSASCCCRQVSGQSRATHSTMAANGGQVNVINPRVIIYVRQEDAFDLRVTRRDGLVNHG